MEIKSEDVEMFESGLKAYRYALINQDNLSQAPEAVTSYIIGKIDEIDRLLNTYFPD